MREGHTVEKRAIKAFIFIPQVLVDGILETLGILFSAAFDTQFLTHVIENGIGVCRQDVVAKRHASKQVIITHPCHASHSQRFGCRIARSVNQTGIMVHQHFTVDIQGFLDDVFAISQPLAVAGRFIDFPSSGSPSDVVTHYGPLALALHDDAVLIHQGAQCRHRLVGLECRQRQIDGTVQAADVVRHMKTPVVVDSIGNAFNRHII